MVCATNGKTLCRVVEMRALCTNGKNSTGNQGRKKLSQIMLSNDIICSRIHDLDEDNLQQLIVNITANPVKVSLELDESTDVCFLVSYWFLCSM